MHSLNCCRARSVRAQVPDYVMVSHVNALLEQQQSAAQHHRHHVHVQIERFCGGITAIHILLRLSGYFNMGQPSSLDTHKISLSCTLCALWLEKVKKELCCLGRRR